SPIASQACRALRPLLAQRCCASRLKPRRRPFPCARQRPPKSMARTTNAPRGSKVTVKFTDVGSAERDLLFVPAGLGALALMAAFFGRGLSAALPGAVVGFDALVRGVLALGAFASQLFAIAGAPVSLRLALWLATHRGLPFALKAALAAASVCVCLVVFFSAQPRLFVVGPLVLGVVS